MTRRRATWTRRAYALAISSPIVALAPIGATARASTIVSSAPRSSLVANIRKAVAGARSAHFQIASTVSGTTDGIVGDTGPTSGEQIIRSGSSVARLLVLPGNAYFSGNRAGLEKFFGMPANDVSKVGTKWVSVTSSAPQYTSFRTSVDSSLLMTYLPTTEVVRVVRTVASGRAEYSLSWVATTGGRLVHDLLTVDASGPALPIKDVVTAGKDRETTIFTHWGERLTLERPRATIMIASLAGG